MQLLPRDQWVAPSSVVLQDEGTAKDENTEEDDEEKQVHMDFELDQLCLCLHLAEVYVVSTPAECSLVWVDGIWVLCDTNILQLNDNSHFCSYCVLMTSMSPCV